MNRVNKVYMYTIVSIIIISFFIGYLTRKSIYDLDISSIDESKYKVEFNLDVQGSNLRNAINDIQLADESSELIIKGEFTGKRKILYGCVESELKILSVYKGDIEEDLIYLYEPINIVDFKNMSKISNEVEGSVSLTNGYNLLKPKTHYILLLDKVSSDNFQEEYLNKYKYNNISLSKFDLDDDDDYMIINNSTENSNISTFDKIKDINWIFTNKEEHNNYSLAKNFIINRYLKN